VATYPVGPTRTYTTIQAAITAAGAAVDYDAQIPVDFATYVGDFSLNTRAPGNHAMPVHVYAADPLNRPTIVPAGGGYNITASNGHHADAGTRFPVFRNLVWSGGSNTNALVNASGANPMHFIGCDFISLTKIIFRYANAGTSHARRWEIRKCRFDACTGGEVVSAADVGYGLIEGCRFRHTSGAYSMVLCSTVSNWLAYNNSVSSTAGGGYLFQCRDAYNNAVHVASSSPLKLFVVNGTFDYNVFNWAGSNSGTNGGHNNAAGVPGFANPTAGDFSITAASPCYNTGTTLADVTTDYLGTARPQGASYDVGAYELIATATVSTVTVLGPTSVRLNLSSSVASDATWATAGNYTLTSGTGAAVTVSSAAASGNPGSSITLTTTEHTNGATYTVAWAGLLNVTSGSTTYTGQGTAPTFTAAFTSAQTMRLTFSEAMTNNAALTTASNYTLTPTAGAGFAPTAVTRIDSTRVDLTVDRSLGAATGTLTVANLTDLGGNAQSPSSVAIAVWAASPDGAVGRLESGASFVRILLNEPVFRDAATWVGSSVEIMPYLRATYYGVGGSPAPYVDFITSDASDGVNYVINVNTLLGVNGDGLGFTGAGVPGGRGTVSGPVYGAAIGFDGAGGTLDGLLPWDLMPSGVGSELSWERLVLVSLHSDARIGAGIKPPDGTTDRRGWWGDTYTDGTPAASRLWLIAGSAAPTAREIEDAVLDALAWVIADGLADSVTARTTLEGGRAETIVEIVAQGEAVTVKVPALWSDYAG
jgi:phage gp46-like protein